MHLKAKMRMELKKHELNNCYALGTVQSTLYYHGADELIEKVHLYLSIFSAVYLQ